MAGTVARLCYASNKRPIAIKQRVQEASVAHPERVGAKSEVGGATVTRVDAHSGHGGTSDDDGGAPATVLDKMTKQQGIKHHGIKAKLELR